MTDLIDLSDSPTPYLMTPTSHKDDDLLRDFAPSTMPMCGQDLIVLNEDLLDLNTPSDPETAVEETHARPSSPLLSTEQALKLFDPLHGQAPESTKSGAYPDALPAVFGIEEDRLHGAFWAVPQSSSTPPSPQQHQPAAPRAEIPVRPTSFSQSHVPRAGSQASNSVNNRQDSSPRAKHRPAFSYEASGRSHLPTRPAHLSRKAPQRSSLGEEPAKRLESATGRSIQQKDSVAKAELHFLESPRLPLVSAVTEPSPQTSFPRTATQTDLYVLAWRAETFRSQHSTLDPHAELLTSTRVNGFSSGSSRSVNLQPLTNSQRAGVRRGVPPHLQLQAQPTATAALAPVFSPRRAPLPRPSDTPSGTDSGQTDSEGGYFHAPTQSEMISLSQEALADNAAYRRYLSLPSPRLQAGLLHSGMSRLEESVMQSWMAAEPSQDRVKAIETLLTTLTAGLNKWEEKRSGGQQPRVLRVDPFGSVAWGGSTGRNGDVDLVIIDKRLPEGYHPSLWRKDPVGEKYADMRRMVKSKRSLYNIYQVNHLLSNLAGVSGCRTVNGASVPIVKFVYQGMECDIAINDLGGWYNSKLVLAYCQLSPFVLRPLIHFLKIWASRFNLNDPAAARGSRTFSSYCLTLMAIAYLQKVGHLPNLQQGVEVPPSLDPANVDMPHTIWVSWGRRQAAAAHVWFRETPPEDWAPAAISLGDAITGFFSFLKDFDPSRDVISVLNGGVIPRSHSKGAAEQGRNTFLNMLTGPNHSPVEVADLLRDYDQAEKTNWHEGMGTGTSGIQPMAWTRESLIVQDPFIYEKNCAGGISQSSVETFFSTIHITHLKLSRGREQSITELLR